MDNIGDERRSLDGETILFKHEQKNRHASLVL